MQKACKNTNNYIIINTLDGSMQNCLILNTTKIENEEYSIQGDLHTEIYNFLVNNDLLRVE